MTTAVVDAKIRQLRAEEKALAKAAKRAHEAELRRKAEAEVKREAARATRAEQARKIAEADDALAGFGVELRVSYKGLIYTVHPEQTTDAGIRQIALNSLREVQAICATDFERRRYAARCAAMGKELPMPGLAPQSFERLRQQIEDATAAARRHPGIATLTTVAEEKD